jgi:hypothetical protein
MSHQGCQRNEWWSVMCVVCVSVCVRCKEEKESIPEQGVKMMLFCCEGRDEIIFAGRTAGSGVPCVCASEIKRPAQTLRNVIQHAPSSTFNNSNVFSLSLFPRLISR